MADDLLAGLESSEPRQLKWSLKLEPTCREGRREPARERKHGRGRRRKRRRTKGERRKRGSRQTVAVCRPTDLVKVLLVGHKIVLLAVKIVGLKTDV